MIDEEIIKDLESRITITVLNEVFNIQDILFLHNAGLTITLEDGYITNYTY